MIKLGSYEVPRYIKYTINLSDVIDSDNTYMTFDGKTHTAVITQKWNIILSAQMCDTTTATNIFNVIKQTEFNITFTDVTGTEYTKTFRCPNRPMDLTNRIGTIEYWNIDLTFEEV